MAFRRKKLGKSHSRKMFTRTASGTHPRNVRSAQPMRGGIRL